MEIESTMQKMTVLCKILLPILFVCSVAMMI